MFVNVKCATSALANVNKFTFASIRLKNPTLVFFNSIKVTVIFSSVKKDTSLFLSVTVVKILFFSVNRDRVLPDSVNELREETDLVSSPDWHILSSLLLGHKSHDSIFHGNLAP